MEAPKHCSPHHRDPKKVHPNLGNPTYGLCFQDLWVRGISVVKGTGLLKVRGHN